MAKYFTPQALYELIQETLHTSSYNLLRNTSETSIQNTNTDASLNFYSPTNNYVPKAKTSTTIKLLDLEVINTIIKERTTRIDKVASFLHIDNSALALRLKDLKSEEYFKQIFLPTKDLFPEVTILFINMEYLNYEKLLVFLQNLPYVIIETVQELIGNRIWRIITINTRYGDADYLIQTIIEHFNIDILKILRVNSLKKKEWQLPVHYFNEETHIWNLSSTFFNDLKMFFIKRQSNLDN